MRTLRDIFNTQAEIQKQFYETDEKGDLIQKPEIVYKFATAAMVEIVEMLQTDTRWKKVVTGSLKSPSYDKEDFAEEYADVLLYLMNVAHFAGLSYDDILMNLKIKQRVNVERFGLNEKFDI